MKRLLKTNAIVVLAAVLLLAVLVVTVLAAEIEMTQTWVAGESEPTSTVNGEDTPPWGYPNVTVPEGYQTEGNEHGGLYRFMTNYWNPDTAIAGVFDSVTMEATLEESTGEFWVTVSPDAYWPDGRDGPCDPEDEEDGECNWTPNNIHAPATYPAIYKGCHWGQCSAGTDPGAPFPMKVSEVASLPSEYTVDLSGVSSSGVFNVAYDIWLDQNLSGYLPDDPKDVNQNE